MIVKKANAFAKFVKEKQSDANMSKEQKKEVKDIQKEYNKLYEIASKQLTFISKDLGQSTKVQTIGQNRSNYDINKTEDENQRREVIELMNEQQ